MNELLPLVSVFCPTYNHDKYISQCLDGIVMQQTNFDIEVIVQDDASTDYTSEIIEKYSSKYNYIIPNLHKENQYSKGKNLNEYFFKNAKGKYVAFCEGDDYWTDPYKLQKQVDFLEANPDFAICFHNARILYEDGPEKLNYSNSEGQKEISNFEDLIKGEYIYTATCMFRREDVIKYPPEFSQYLNNYTIDLHNAQFGKIRFLNEIMSVYRVHKGGVWSMVQREQTLINQLPTYKFYINYFDKKYKHDFKVHVKNMLQEILFIKLQNKEYKDYWKYYLDFAINSSFNLKELKFILYLFIKPIQNKFKRC